MNEESQRPSESSQYASALRDMSRRYERLVREISILRELSECDDPLMDIEEICRRIVESLAFQMTAENCSLMMVSPERTHLELRAACSPLDEKGISYSPGGWKGRRFLIGEGAMGKVAETGVPIRIEDTDKEPGFVSYLDCPIVIRSLMCFPLRVHDSIIGVLNLSHPQPAFFTLESEKTMELVAERASRILSTHLLHQQLRESEAHYRMVTENAADGILVMTLDGRILNANPAIQQITGTPPARFIGGEASWESGVHPEDLDRYLGHRKSVAASHTPLTLDYRFFNADGQTRFLEQRCSRLAGTTNGEKAIVCIIRDATERKRAEEENVRLVTAIEQAAEAVVITDIDGNIVYVNPAFLQITGYTREEAIGQNPRILKSGRHDPAFYRDLWATLSRCEVWRGRFTNKRKDGALYEEEAIISPIRGKDGRLINFVAVKRDVTQEVRLEEQLRQAQKMEAVGQLAGGVAHDFNNLLTGIIGNVSMALRDASDKSRQRLLAAEKAGSRAAELVKQLLAFSRKSQVVMKPTEIGIIVDEVAAIARDTFDRGIEIQVHRQDELRSVLADAAQIHQVLLNLCINGRDALDSPTGGSEPERLRTLRIDARNTTVTGEYCAQNPFATPGEFIVLSVTDNGAGMDDETRKHIFEPFFTTKEPGKGTGLGLATVYGIVKQHSGWITVESEPGRGSSFHVYLPALQGHGVKEAAPRRCSLPSGHETVLFVDDEEMVRDLAKSILESLGYSLLFAEDGVRALEIFQEASNRIHLTILDISMPRLSGWDVLKKIRESNPEAKVLISSGFLVQYSAMDLQNAGALGFVSKPYRAGDLARAVREALDA